MSTNRESVSIAAVSLVNGITVNGLGEVTMEVAHANHVNQL